MPNGSPSLGARFALALLRAAVVFATAIACALLLPTPYEAAALIRSDRDLPGEARDLLELGLDRALLERLSRERSGDALAQPKALAEAASGLISSVRIERLDARVLRITVEDTDAERAQRHCNEIARNVVARASRAPLADKSAHGRTDAAAELLRFVSGHPPLWTEPASKTSGSKEGQARVPSLLAERALIQKTLSEVVPEKNSEGDSDNPYAGHGSTRQTNPAQLNRRLLEIDVALANERKGATQPPQELDAPETHLTARLGELLSRVGKPAATPSSSEGVITLAALAPRPSWPLRSTGSFVLLFGGLSAIFVFLFPELGREARLRRARPESPGDAATSPGGGVEASAHDSADDSTLPPEAEVGTTPTPKTPAIRAEPRIAPPEATPSAPALPSQTRDPVLPPHSSGEDSTVMAYPLEGWSPPATTERCRSLCLELQALTFDTSLVVTVSGASSLAALRSRVALELALTLSETPETRALLIEADFGRAPGTPLLNVGTLTARNFSEQLEARDAGSTEQRWFVTACTGSLHALLDRTNGLTSADRIASKSFKDCVLALQEYYDFIVIAGPPLEKAQACRAADAVSDAIVVVHGENQPLDPRSWPFSKHLMLLSVRG